MWFLLLVPRYFVSSCVRKTAIVEKRLRLDGFACRWNFSMIVLVCQQCHQVWQLLPAGKLHDIAFASSCLAVWFDHHSFFCCVLACQQVLHLQMWRNGCCLLHTTPLCNALQQRAGSLWNAKCAIVDKLELFAWVSRLDWWLFTVKLENEWSSNKQQTGIHAESLCKMPCQQRCGVFWHSKRFFRLSEHSLTLESVFAGHAPQISTLKHAFHHVCKICKKFLLWWLNWSKAERAKSSIPNFGKAKTQTEAMIWREQLLHAAFFFAPRIHPNNNKCDAIPLLTWFCMCVLSVCPRSTFLLSC